MEETLSPDQRVRFDPLFDHVTDQVVARYVDEAKSCLRVGACRAAVVMVWCGLIYHMHQQVLLVGIEHFERCLHQIQTRKEKDKQDLPLPRIKALSDLRQIKDVLLPEILRDMEILKTEADYRTLDDFRQLRNDCAHAEPRSVDVEEVIMWFRKIEPFLLTNPGANISLNSPRYVARCAEDVNYELTWSRAQFLVGGLTTVEYRGILANELVALSYKPDTTPEQQERCRRLWPFLNLDEVWATGVNRKIGEVAAKTPKISQVPARHLVYWSCLEQSDLATCRCIVFLLFEELQAVVNSDSTTEEDDYALAAAVKCSVGRLHDEYSKLFDRAKRQLEARR